MRILRSLQHKSCADGSYMKEYLLDEPVSADFFSYLKNFGRVTSMPNLGDGYYTFEKTDWFSIKGFAGDTSVEVRFKTETMDITTDFLLLVFSSYHPGGIDLTTLKAREKTRDGKIRVLLRRP